MPHTILQLDVSAPEILAQYKDLAARLDYPRLFGSPDGYILVTDVQRQLVAAVTVLPTSGAYIVFEDFMLNPDMPVQLRHQAAEMVAEQIIRISNTSGKVPLCPLTFRGGINILRRMGFYGHDVHIMTRDLEPLPIGEYDARVGDAALPVDVPAVPEELPEDDEPEPEDLPVSPPISPIIGKHTAVNRMEPDDNRIESEG